MTGKPARFLAVLTVRNEAAFLLEWLAHHRATGFTDFLVFSNDCRDGTDTMLDRLAELGWLTHLRNDGPFDKRGIQFTALKQAERLDIVRNADWILPLDIDEFVNIHVGDHTLSALLAALPDATAITLTWRLFGNAGIRDYTDVPVTETFTRCAPVAMHWPWRSAMFKTLYRNDGAYRKLGVHRPRDPDSSRLHDAQWFDGEGRPLDHQFKTRRLFSNYGRSNYRLVQLNHYPLGAMQSYVLKADRGRAVHSDHLLGMDYWVDRNFNTDTDDSIADICPRSTPLRAGLQADPLLGPLHRAAVDWRHARFRKLMEQEPYRALYARLLMTPPSRPIDLSTAHMLRQFAIKGHRES
ncbi:glycosyltransferase family 2 protein [Sedimentitalea sp. XS_ASV28]|uniref:glycosyltransferase family 2 protein n=1 Tax=Sedimentitalea sp. XS_ASV28 TaxID=3241296 RepID=UPI003517623F